MPALEPQPVPVAPFRRPRRGKGRVLGPGTVSSRSGVVWPTAAGPDDTGEHDERQEDRAEVARAWVSSAAGAHLCGRVTRNTKPEVVLRQRVHALGLRFRPHVPVAPRCTPDFVMPRHRVAVFVDGCSWHGCPEHGPSDFRGPNADRWREKITTNRQRAQRNTAAAEAAGWTVVRLWECEIRRDSSAAALRVRSATRTGG
ncbi:very short patch repair endonuclease [Kitasatospora sp. NPDC056800]|uniref:very short patch repair endonuclease n=1 Tax=Kitasatospora sp. NPDC056800 TaxID=3345948 RepID=UPI0036D0C137